MENKSVIIPVQFEAGSVFVVRKDAITSAVTDSKEYTDGENEKITNKLSTIEQTAKDISAHVEENTTNIDTLKGRVTSTETNYSNLKMQADEIAANVANNKTEVDGKISTLTEQQAEFSTTAQEIKGTVSDVTTLKGRMDTYEENYSKIEQKADSIESTVNSMKTATGNNMFSFKNANFEIGHAYIQDYGFICPPYSNSPCRVSNLGTNGRGGEYVVSFDIYSWGQCPELNLCFCKAAGIHYTPVANAWKHVDLKYTVSNDDPYIASDDYNGFFYISDNTNTNLAIRNFQVVRGNMVSEFSYSQDDLNDVENKDLGITNTVNAENYTVLDNSDPSNPTYVQKTERYTHSEENVDGKTRDVYTLNYKQKETDFDFITSNGNFTLKQNRAYTLSFYAKKTDTDANYITCHLQPSILGSTYETLYKPSDLIKKAMDDGKSAKEAESPYIGKQSISASSDGYTEVILDSKWRKYYIHFYVQNQASNLNYVAARIPANSTDFTLSISDVKLEEGFVTGDYNSYKSVVRQTANEILQQVGDTYIRIGDAITLNGDTNINGTLVLTDESERGFIIKNNSGDITKIAPQSIGSYSDFAKTSTAKEWFNQSNSLWSFNADGTRSVSFVQNIGTLKSGSTISFSNVAIQVKSIDNDSWVGKSGINRSTIQVVGDYGKSTAYTQLTRDIDISVNSLGSVTTSADGDISIIVTIYINDKAGKMCTAYANWITQYPIGNSSAYTIVGYDGIASRFGTGDVVYIGKSGLHAKYGNYELYINNEGIVGNNIHKVIARNNSSQTYTSNIAIKDYLIYDTFIITGYAANIILPPKANCYDGMTLTIIDKASSCSVVSNGIPIMRNDNTSTRTSSYELEGNSQWQYIYYNEVWYEMRCH